MVPQDQIALTMTAQRQNRSVPLARTLTVSFITLSILALFSASAIQMGLNFRAQQEILIARQQAAATDAAGEVSSLIEQVLRTLETSAQIGRPFASSAADRRLLLSSVLDQQPAFEQVALVNGRGREVVKMARDKVFTDDEMQDRSEDAFFASVKDGESTVTSLYLDQNGRPLITVAVPVKNVISGFEGALVAEVNVTFMWDTVTSLKIGKNGLAYVVDQEGMLIAFRDTQRVLDHVNVSQLSPVARFLREEPNSGSIDQGIYGASVLSSYVPLKTPNWAVVVEVPVSEAYQPVWTNLLLSIGVTAFVALLAGWRGLYLGRRLATPVHTLQNVVLQIAAGDLTLDAPIQGSTELRHLANAVNSMTQQLRDWIRSLEQRVAQRTRDLKVAAEVSRQVTTLLKLEDLLPQLAELTRQSFDLYHVGVFLYQPQDDTLSLAAATGISGAKMLEQGRIFKRESTQGLVPLAARENRPVVSNDVIMNTSHIINALLPATRSESTFPMTVGGTLVGVLDLQSEQLERFTVVELEVFSLLASQIAVAVRNAQLFEEAQRARQLAEQADKVKSSFLANMSHELRTPLNAIINFTHFVSTGVFGDVNEEQTETLEKVIHSATHLLGLINDVLDISKIESGLMNLFIEQVDLNQLVKSVSASAKGIPHNEDVELVTEIQSDLPTLAADKRRLRQILLNLISNALKFTSHGQVTLGAFCEEGNVVFRVSDTGVGIAPEHLEVIFQPFKQTRDGISKGGTGLGLPISRYMAEAHGGKLWVESHPGQGTTFYVSIPVTKDLVH